MTPDPPRSRSFRRLLRGIGGFLAWVLLAALLVALAGIAAVHLRRGAFRPKHRGFVRFALCQYDARVGDIRWSFLHAMDFAREAVRHGADVVVLPEFSFSSLHDVRTREAVFDIWQRPGFAERLDGFVRRNGCYLVFNHSVLSDDPDRPGRTVHRNVSQVLGPDGTLLATYAKRELAWVDRRCGFAPGEEETIVEFPFGKIGMMICKDSAFPERFAAYRDADAVLIQFAHLSHWGTTPQPFGLREPTSTVGDKMAVVSQACVDVLRKPLLMVNKSGLEDEFAYIGDSRVVAANGTCLAAANSDCRILYADFPLDANGRIDAARHPVIPDNPVDWNVEGRFPRLRKLRRSLLRLEAKIP